MGPKIGYDKYEEFVDRIHDKKNEIPEYISIIIREGKKKEIIDVKIRKLESKVIKILVHEQEKKGWYAHSYHIPLKNLGLPEDAKNKQILPYLNHPAKIMSDKATQGIVKELIEKYVEVISERKKHFFHTARYKVKKDYSGGRKMKAF